MTGVTDQEFKNAVWHAQKSVESIRNLARAAERTLSQMSVDLENVQANLDHDTVKGIQDGIEALADKALAKLEWIDEACHRRQEPGDGA